MVLFHFNFLQTNYMGEKGGNFMVSPGRYSASLGHSQWHSKGGPGRHLLGGGTLL